MDPIRTPKSKGAATAMLERFARVDAAIGGIEDERNAAIGRVNAEADAALAPMITERDAIRDKLTVWWREAGHALADGKRKSIELGGCMIGSRAGKPSLGIDGDEAVIITALQRRDWAAPLLRTKVSIDKAAVLKSIDGVYKRQLEGMGFSRVVPEETVWIERTAQAGTVTGTKP
jgi:phage host-nuclease inhibitor protein Gam